jgi:hypothetical protein
MICFHSGDYPMNKLPSTPCKVLSRDMQIAIVLAGYGFCRLNREYIKRKDEESSMEFQKMQ